MVLRVLWIFVLSFVFSFGEELIVKTKGDPPPQLTVNGDRLKLVKKLPLPNTGLYRVEGRAEVRELTLRAQSLPNVVYAEPNYRIKPYLIPNDPLYGYQWYLPVVKLPAVWDIRTSASVITAVLDTGIKPSQDLDGRILKGYDFVDNDQDPTDTCVDSHGTAVASIIASLTNNNWGMSGVTWSGQVLMVRVSDCNGGTLSALIEGLIYAAQGPYPASVINISLGSADPGSCPQSLQEAINTVLSQPQRPVIVVAAGNESSDASRYFPANCNGVIVVGATDTQGKKASFSNYGDKVDIYAPGSSILVNVGGDVFYKWDGTSFSTPIVSGTVALIKSQRPELEWYQVRDYLRLSASYTSDGFPFLNAYMAFLTASSYQPSQVVAAGGGGGGCQIGGEASGWGYISLIVFLILRWMVRRVSVP
ncbi:peptidase S8 and S53 subtilisin kexin sedolisin [Thermocrinis albus DSM 14484]|uniref:Peptidase S8 and S53 subtilisin kexin sedolisin n=1 Tax=Thermocrinis albus (strain DSM 14484 / JCM 11386 / HI 11/12) TaxID=638303 RepID=D3SPK8_THEAH|nr:S8 family serine peptidase [Thermocrinis albus]ADC89095.1 peptidase S8 and S53 subtilisin kexin sedolisin [Thermocrinis albus DSM 14484]